MTIICSACGGTCTGEVLKVQDKHFHINCFKCHECSCLLASGGYFPRNDNYYCSKDYHRLFGTRCKSCGDFVEGRVITALGNSYHPECFNCDRCGGEIRSGTVVTYNDKEEILCQNCSPDVSLSDTPPPDFTSPSPTHTSHDHKEQSPVRTPPPPRESTRSTSTTLTDHSPTITSRHTSASPAPKTRPTSGPSSQERTTTTTSSSFDDVFDFSKVPDIDPETRPYLGKCAQCQDVIRSAQSLIALNRHWHLFCFSCARCKRYLTNEYMDNGDQAYCEPCFQELYGLICETCQEYITGTVLEAGDCHFHPACAFCSKCSLRFNEGDDLCISSEEVWHLDCDRAKRSGPAIVSSLPPQEKHIKTRPSSENFPRNVPAEEIKMKTVGQSPTPGGGSRPSSRPSSRMTPDSQNPPVIYPLKELQLIGKVCLPKGVNRTKLEQHLTDSDFFTAFCMDRNTFCSKPQWKQIELKKKANLF